MIEAGAVRVEVEHRPASAGSPDAIARVWYGSVLIAVVSANADRWSEGADGGYYRLASITAHGAAEPKQ